MNYSGVPSPLPLWRKEIETLPRKESSRLYTPRASESLGPFLSLPPDHSQPESTPERSPAPLIQCGKQRKAKGNGSLDGLQSICVGIQDPSTEGRRTASSRVYVSTVFCPCIDSQRTWIPHSLLAWLSHSSSQSLKVTSDKCQPPEISHRRTAKVLAVHENV